MIKQKFYILMKDEKYLKHIQDNPFLVPIECIISGNCKFDVVGKPQIFTEKYQVEKLIRILDDKHLKIRELVLKKED